MAVGSHTNSITRTCKFCGKEFTSLRESHLYCDAACRCTAQEKRRLSGEQRGEHVCPVCGNKFSPSNNYQKYCSVACKRKHINSVRFEKHDHSARKCPICGAEFVPHNGFQRYCDTDCSKEAIRRNRNESRKRPEVKAKRSAYGKAYYSRPEVKKHHKEYGISWVTKNRDKVRAIKEKYKISEKGLASKRRYESGTAYKAARHRKDVLRRFKKQHNGTLPAARDIHWSTLVTRLGSMKCMICGCICDPNSKDRGLYPTVDHVKSLHDGGSHSWENVVLLCERCNSTKGGKRTLEETLARVRQRKLEKTLEEPT